MAGENKGKQSKSQNPRRKARRLKNWDKLPYQRLRHVLRYNGIRAAWTYATDDIGHAAHGTAMRERLRQLLHQVQHTAWFQRVLRADGRPFETIVQGK